MAAALKDVHTLISVIWSFDNIVEINRVLIDGAVQAGVKRFIPSEWSGREKCNELIDWYHPRVDIIELIKRSGLEWTAVRIGLFMNDVAVGSVHEKEALGGLRSQTVVIDMKNGTAEVPGTGDEKLGLIRVEDVGTVVTKIVEIEGHWEKEYLITGDMTTYNQILKVAEDIAGEFVFFRRSAVLFFKLELTGKMIQVANLRSNILLLKSFRTKRMNQSRRVLGRRFCGSSRDVLPRVISLVTHLVRSTGRRQD